MLHKSKNPVKMAKSLKVIEADPDIPPNETIYIKNLNEKVKIPVLKAYLEQVFNQFGKIRQIIAMTSFWRRGQAWIVFDNIDSATKAISAMQGHIYQGHTMQINFALDKSDIVAKEQGTFVERPPGPKKPRAVKEREAKQFELFQQMQKSFMESNLSDETASASYQGVDSGLLMASAQAIATESAISMSRLEMGDASQQQPRTIQFQQRGPGVPHRILFVENLPPDVNPAIVSTLFSQRPGFIESRVISSRCVAFVDFDSEQSAGLALKALQGHSILGSNIYISYAKK